MQDTIMERIDAAVPPRTLINVYHSVINLSSPARPIPADYKYPRLVSFSSVVQVVWGSRIRLGLDGDQ